MTRIPPDTSAEEPDGGNLQVRLRRGPGSGDRPRLLDRTYLAMSCAILATLLGSAVTATAQNSDTDSAHAVAFVKDSAITTNATACALSVSEFWAVAVTALPSK